MGAMLIAFGLAALVNALEGADFIRSVSEVCGMMLRLQFDNNAAIRTSNHKGIKVCFCQ